MTEQAHPPTELPPRETIMLAAFEGWNDAGSAASQALEHLHEVWGAEQVDELDPEEYHDFQVNRPVLGIGPDGKREIAWPTTAVAVATAPRSGRQIVLVHGIEPSMRWRRYCTELLDIAAGLGVRTVITVGALLADVPHTRPIPVTMLALGTAYSSAEDLPYIPNAARGLSSRNGLPGSSSRSIRSRTRSLPRSVCRCRAASLPPRRTTASRSRSSSTSSRSPVPGGLTASAEDMSLG